ncbi:MAG TPA: hypothetical protein PKY01_04045 [Candidatus Hydrogenedentes bacterium]|nr:hypothetical protein [Candidatus Hydrogenedentota bacterium]
MNQVHCTLTVFVMVVLGAFAGEDASPFVSSPPRTHTECITAPHAAYVVDVAGYLDMDNTMTRSHAGRAIAFQNNVSLTIANTGGQTVRHPRIITNGKRRWATIDEMLAEFTGGARTPQEKVYLIWENMRQNMHHDDPIMKEDLHDPVRLLNIYGAGLCDDAGACGAVLFDHAGFTAERVGADPFVRSLHGHMQCEVFVEGAYQFMDIDQDCFFLDRENGRPVSGDECVRDHDLVKRESAYGPELPPWESLQTNAALFGVDDDRTGMGSRGHRMEYVLRPGERMVFRWDNIGKRAYESSKNPHRYFGNSKLVYEPRLDASAPRFLDAFEGFETRDGALAVVGPSASLTIRTETCYTICGGLLRALVEGASEEGRCSVSISANNEPLQAVWEGAPDGRTPLSIALDDALGVHGNPPRRQYMVQILLENAVGAKLSGIVLETDLVASPLALPRLNVGPNHVEYTDETEGPREVTVTHEWVECEGERPPEPPAAPEAPLPGTEAAETFVTFKWPAAEGCDAYWIRISRREDCAYPYRPNYDVVVTSNEYTVRQPGMFNPGEVYYWRVRPRSAAGVWGAWSPVWRFTWKGPMAPRNPSFRVDGQTITLVWEPNPNGERPVQYEVYGSDERGFTGCKDAHEVLGRGAVPGNLAGVTPDTAMVVVSPDAEGANMNCGYYRVAAVDAQGVASAASELVELPRPFVYTRPVTKATAGSAYRCEIKTLKSLGDLQSRYTSPRMAFREAEAYSFVLENGPAWLRCGETSGVLQGIPGPQDVGEHEVVVGIAATYPEEVSEAEDPNGHFQKRRTKPQYRVAGSHRFVLQTVNAGE